MYLRIASENALPAKWMRAHSKTRSISILSRVIKFSVPEARGPVGEIAIVHTSLSLDLCVSRSINSKIRNILYSRAQHNRLALPDMLRRLAIFLALFQGRRGLQAEATAKLMTALHHLCREIPGRNHLREKRSCATSFRREER